MFGSKSSKSERLNKTQRLIAASGEIQPAELARQLGVAQSTVSKDLVALQDQGVLLCEDDTGRLSLFERWFGKGRGE